MTPSDSQSVIASLAIVLVVYVVVLLGLYVWYALALSKLFPKIGAESWKGWVPVLNEMEILTKGGVPGWSVVYYFIPIVQLYGLYLKATAVHRINDERFGRGVGFTVLGVLLPPVWASILAWGKTPSSDEFDRRVAGMMPSGSATGPLAAPPAQSQFAPTQRDASGYAIPGAPAAELAPTTDNGFPPPPPAPSAPPAGPPAPPTPTEAPGTITAPPGFITNPWAATPPAPPAPPVATPEPAPAFTPEPAAPSGPVFSAPPAPPQVDFPRLPATGPDAAPPAPPVAAPAPVVPAPAPVTPPAPPVVAAVPPVASPASAPAALEIDDDIDEETIVVDRRPKVPWRLEVDGGHSFALTADRVLLGRKPLTEGPTTQSLPVPDETRTLSKTHARLDLIDGQWTVTDLDSTNGVIVVDASGTENLLPENGSAVVTDKFILGKVAMNITFADRA